MSEHKEPIPSMIYNASVGGHVTNSQQIIDENLNREQNDINQETVGAVPYNSITPNGMGRIVLKKNDNFKQVVEAQTNGNTIFVIKYDFTLTDNVTVPANCVLEFDGGSISGAYTLTGNSTGIQAGLVKIFNTDVTLAGIWNIIEAYPEWFGAKGDGETDDIGAINKTIASFLSCYFTKDVYKITSSILVLTNTLIRSRNTKTIIKYSNTIGTAILLQSNCRRASITDIQIVASPLYNNTNNNTTCGISFNETNGGEGNHFSHLLVEGFEFGIYGKDLVWGNYFEHCRIQTCKDCIYINSARGSLNNVFIGCYFDRPYRRCITLVGVTRTSFINCNFGCGYLDAVFIFIYTNCHETVFLCCNFETAKVSSNTELFNIGSSNVKFDNCLVHDIQTDGSYTGMIIIFKFSSVETVELSRCRFNNTNSLSNVIRHILVNDANPNIIIDDLTLETFTGRYGNNKISKYTLENVQN